MEDEIASEREREAVTAAAANEANARSECGASRNHKFYAHCSALSP